MNQVGIVAALAAEARVLKSAGAAVQVIHSGMGAAAADHAAQRLIANGACGLMTFGLAGGLDPALTAGSVLLPHEIIAWTGARFATAAPWRERLLARLPRIPVVPGALLSSPQPMASREDKAAAFSATGAIAVDMESAAVAQRAAEHRLPFVCLRVVVDTAHDVLPGSVARASRGGSVQVGRLLLGLAMAPREIAGLLMLARRYRAAMQELRRVGAAVCAA